MLLPRFPATRNALSTAIVEAAGAMSSALDNGNKLLICGNGGSASDALHFSGELLCRFERDRRALPAIALPADTATLTATGNDYDFSQIFPRQVEAFGQPGDLLVPSPLREFRKHTTSSNGCQSCRRWRHCADWAKWGPTGPRNSTLIFWEITSTRHINCTYPGITRYNIHACVI
ncbi:MAG: hypothetical protein CM1200mP41_30560 [Gammaproteobacteria bacterium]|nr:MAG: hypothetical protein CM1200mP41_30560 [Gammaproteobacteria bacterium]